MEKRVPCVHHTSFGSGRANKSLRLESNPRRDPRSPPGYTENHRNGLPDRHTGGPAESVVTMTPKDPQRRRGRQKNPQTAKRSAGPPTRRSKRTREQPSPESSSKRQRQPVTVKDGKHGSNPDQQHVGKSTPEPGKSTPEPEKLEPFMEDRTGFAIGSSSESDDDRENDPDYITPCEYSSYHSPEMEISYSSNPDVRSERYDTREPGDSPTTSSYTPEPSIPSIVHFYNRYKA